MKSAARAWLSERYPLDRDFDAPQDDRWAELAELGWLGVSLSEDEGGVGLGFVEEALILEEMGYALYPGPYLATVGFALPALGPEDRAAVAAGTTKWSAEIHGLVPWLGSVDTSSAATERRTPARGEEIATVDPTGPRPARSGERHTARRRASSIPRARRRGGRGGRRRTARARARESSTRRRASSSARRSACTRPCRTSSPNTYADVELARSLAYWAAWCVAEEDEQAPLAAAAAKAFATEAAVKACERSIQVHGGIGFTWEHPLHRFYKRALWLEGFGRRPAELRAEIADALLGVAVTA